MSSTSRRSNRSPPVARRSSRRFATAIDDNPVFAFAREHGYTTVSVGSGFEQVTARKTDVFVDSGDMNEFEVSLLASTFLGDIVNLVAPTFAASQQAARIEHNLDTLPTIAGAGGEPVFVWAHVPAPHQPTVFAADGSVVEVPLTDTFYGDSPMERGEDPAEFRERYRAQLGYLNDRIVETVDAIVRAVCRAAGDPPVRGPWLGIPRRLDRGGAQLRWTLPCSSNGRASSSPR